MLCSVGLSYAAESFEDANVGDFESLKTDLGTFKATSPAEITDKFAKEGSQALCIQGGKSKQLQLDFTKPLEKDQSLTLWAGIPAAKGAAMLKTYVIDANGEKHLIDSDKKIPTGKIAKKMEFKLPAGTTGLIWVMTSTVKEGLALDDFELKPIEWSYEDVSMSHAYAFPIMKNGRINPVAYVQVPENLDVTSLGLKVSPAAYVQEVGIAVGPANGTVFAERKHYISAEPKKDGSVIISNETMLPGGNDPLWISIIPSEKAPVGAEITISNLRVMSGKDECRSLAASSHRIGSMVARPGDGVVDPILSAVKPKKGEPEVKPVDCKFFRAPGLVYSRKKKQMIATFDARYGSPDELRNDADIVVSTSKDSGQTWTPITIAMNAGKGNAKGCARPSILENDKGILWLQCMSCIIEEKEATAEGITTTEKGGEKKPDKHTTWQWLMTQSKDGGLNWNTEFVNPTKDMAEGHKDWINLSSGSGTGITTSEGIMVYPAVINEGAKMEAVHAAICTSKDNGKTWIMSEPLPEPSSDGAVVELSDGSLMLNVHNRRGQGKRLVYTTKDLGKTWQEHETNNKSLESIATQCALMSVKSKKYGHILLYVGGTAGSKVKTSDNIPSRRMVIKYSKDDGKTWSKGLVFDDRPSNAGASLCMLGSEAVGVLYESPRGVNLDSDDFGISFLKISLKEIMSAE